MFRAETRNHYRLGFHPWFDVWVVKFKTFPHPDEVIAPKHYDGFHWLLRLPLPYVDKGHNTNIARLLKWDVTVPQWVPRWVLMKDWRDPISRTPRPLLIKFLTKPFIIPKKIKFE